MSGKLLLRALFNKIGHKPSPKKIEHLERLHNKHFGKRLSTIRVLPGARELLRHLIRGRRTRNRGFTCLNILPAITRAKSLFLPGGRALFRQPAEIMFGIQPELLLRTGILVEPLEM